MMDAIYNGLSGMQAYSRGLDVISNNVANLNTVGFKTSTPIFKDLIFQNSSAALDGEPVTTPPGAGVQADTLTESFAQGQLSSTANPLDAAVDGNGFFILNDNGTTLYTRAGQFQINKDGYIVDTTTKALVMFSTAAHAIGPLNVNVSQSDPPKATTSVTLAGNLAQDGSATIFDTPPITVFDGSGASQTVTVHFVRNATSSLKWTAEVHDSTGAVIGSQALTFNTDGTPTASSVSITATITPKVAAKFKVKFTLGSAGSFSGVTDIANGGASTVQGSHVDGQAIGALNKYAFTDKGELQATYSNGDTKTLGTLLLAHFQTQDQLKEIGNGAFVAVGGATPTIGEPLGQGLGRIVGGQIEMSNVDLTGQFTDLIIIQRGYQAGSQMVSTASEMMQELLQMSRGR
jgi:flagellar hook protein FlgE